MREGIQKKSKEAREQTGCVQKIYGIIDEGNDATFLSKHETRSMFSM